MADKMLQKVRQKVIVHPLSIKSGKDKGKLPHQLNEDDYLVWLIEQGMTQSDYEATLASANEFVRAVKRYGKPVRSDHLTDDQRGWAMADHRLHYQFSPYAKWFINPDKPSKPLPATFRFSRNRVYAETCSCTKRKRDWGEWGERHDHVMLLQCDNCGEVFVDPDELEKVA